MDLVRSTSFSRTPRRLFVSSLALLLCIVLADIVLCADAPPVSPALRIDSITPSALDVPQYRKFELRLRFTGVVADPFDPDALDISASVRTPSGRTFLIPGFLAAFESHPPQPPDPVWLVRFTPSELGRYEVSLSVRLGRDSVRAPVQVFTCSKGVAPGFVRLSPRDARFFELDDGSFFYPVGQNVCWARDYEPYFRKMRAAGENFVRVWICPWNCWIEPTGSLARYDLAAAARLDELFALADKYGLRVQLVLVWHGLLNAEAWARNPYNVANGGPCKSAPDFFTDPAARKLFQRQLRYLVARYSWSPSLFAWELSNEIDLADNRDWADLVAWHREMARCLLDLDPHRNLVTASAYDPKLEPFLFALPEIAFATPHRYGIDPVQSVCDAASDNLAHDKPVFLAEFGSIADREGTSALDPRGVLLHAALWSSFHSPASGAAMPWWWDSHVEPNNLYSHFAALARYAPALDRRGRSLKLASPMLDAPRKHSLAVRALLDSAGGSLWVYDRSILLTPRASRLPVVSAGVAVTLRGLRDGPYDVLFWDTRAGVPIASSVLQARAGRIVLTLPRFTADIAVALSPRAPVPRPRPRPDQRKPKLVLSIDTTGAPPLHISS